MATFDYVQTDTSATFNVGCSGQTAGATTDARQAQDTGSAGVTEVSVDPGSNVTRAIFVYDCTPAPNVAEWASGNYVIPVNITTCDGGTQLTRVDVCDFDGTSTYVSVASNTSPGHTRGNTGVVNVTVNRATNYTPQSQANSRVFIVLTFNNNDQHGASGAGITPNQTITTPIVAPAPDDLGRVSWAEMEIPNAPRTGYMSWAELELPNAPRVAYVSWAEFELPNAPRVAYMSWSELELPNAPRTSYMSWAEFEIPDVPGTDRVAYLTWAEMETADAPRTAYMSWAEMEVADAPRTAYMSWAELETPDAPREAHLTWAEFELPDAPRSSFVSWAEFETPNPPRGCSVSWAEFQVPDADSGDWKETFICSNAAYDDPTNTWIPGDGS